MNRYPGNPALAPEIQERIESTFRQTLELVNKGNLKQAQLGCDFILRLDAEFEPGRRLLERLQGATGAVDVSDLEVLGEEESWGAFADSVATTPPAAAIPVAAAPIRDPTARREELRHQLEGLIAAREFEQAVGMAQQEMGLVASDGELVHLATLAQERLEAGPYLLGFLDKARQAKANGDTIELGRLLDKARALDPDHPEIAKLAAPAFEAPPPAHAPGAAPGGGGFDFSELERLPAFDQVAFELAHEGEEAEPEPSAAAPPDQRISQLLREGQEAFERGEPQNAIDAWSRIFLIDIDNAEASRRIEGARRIKAEREREVEEIFHDAVAHFEAGESEQAKEGFERVLTLQPGHFSAREYLERLSESAAAPAPAATPAPAASPPAAEPARRPPPRSQEILVPPDAPAAAATKRGGGAKRSGLSLPGGWLFYAIGGGVLLLVAAAAAFFFLSRDRFFPKTAPAPATTPAAVDPIARARALHAEGKTPVAVAQLRRLPPDSPHYAEAQSLISQWEALAGKKEAEGEKVSPEMLAKRESLLGTARTALGEGENVRALLAFEQAGAIVKLDPPLAALAQQAQERTADLSREIELFRKGDWEFVLNSLWKRRQGKEHSRDVDRLMVDSYYNLGVRDLQRGDSGAAAAKFREALVIDPRDPVLQRLALFSRTYESRGEDLLFRIFVKYLPTR